MENGIRVNSVGISRSHLNLSTAKQLFSFGRADRFGKQRLPYCDAIYGKDSMLSKRGTGIGYGKRFSYSHSTTPAPSRYQFKGGFEPEERRIAFSFGLGRECFKKAYLKQAPITETDAPGPGAYQIQTCVGTEMSKYSMRPKTILKHKDLVPGPGAYNALQATNPRGTHFFSKFKNSATSACRSTDRRFRPEFRRGEAPGPGRYELTRTLTQDGKYNLSNYKSSQCRKFGLSNRNEWFPSDLKIPGPGAYQTPSEFGIYDKPPNSFGDVLKMSRSTGNLHK